MKVLGSSSRRNRGGGEGENLETSNIFHQENGKDGEGIPYRRGGPGEAMGQGKIALSGGACTAIGNPCKKHFLLREVNTGESGSTRVKQLGL